MKAILIFVFVLGVASTSLSQSLGFSYFFPKDGYFGNPIAPINFHLPVSFGNYFRLTPEIGMNNIGGMSMGGIPEPFQSNRPLIGPFQSIQLAVCPSVVIPIKSKKKGTFMEFELIGGIIGFTTINSRIKKGEFESMLLEANNYQMVKTDLTLDNDFAGFGWVFGLKVDFRLKGNIWGYIAGRYYLAKQNMSVTGTYDYFQEGAGSTQSSSLNFDDAYLNYQGFEITIGGGLKKK